MPHMTEPRSERTQADSNLSPEIPERLCTWCQVPMNRRLVGGGQFIHYTCPKCVFQHTSKRAVPEG